MIFLVERNLKGTMVTEMMRSILMNGFFKISIMLLGYVEYQ